MTVSGTRCRIKFELAKALAVPEGARPGSKLPVGKEVQARLLKGKAGNEVTDGRTEWLRCALRSGRRGIAPP